MGAYTFNKKLINSNGLTFIKLLGTGSNGGFSLIPDFSSYVMITSWENVCLSNVHDCSSAHYSKQ